MDQAQQLREAVNLRNQTSTEKEKKVARVIAVTSGKGGVGKSNISVNLAVTLRNMGQKVIIFDADFGLANVEVMFGTVPEYNLSDLIYQGKSIREIITKGPEGIGFISGGSGIVSLNNLTRDQIDYLVRSLQQLNDLTDVLIVDTGAGISDTVLEFVIASPEVLLITTPEPSSLTDSYSLVKALYKNPNFVQNGTNIRLIANKVSSAEEARAVYEKLEQVTNKFLGGSISYLGMVPSDPNLERAVRSQKIVSLEAPTSRASKAYELIAKSLMGQRQDTYRWGISQLFNHFVNKY
jgi:flagellar biosynthesis protein FlhG